MVQAGYPWVLEVFLARATTRELSFSNFVIKAPREKLSLVDRVLTDQVRLWPTTSRRKCTTQGSVKRQNDKILTFNSATKE